MADPTKSQVITAGGFNEADGAAVDIAISVAVTMVTDTLASSGLSTSTKDNIKLLLACHFAATFIDKGAKETVKIGEVTERYHQIYAAGLYATRFGQQAILLDTSGILAELAEKTKNPTRKAQFSHVETEPYSDGDNV